MAHNVGDLVVRSGLKGKAAKSTKEVKESAKVSTIYVQCKRKRPSLRDNGGVACGPAEIGKR